VKTKANRGEALNRYILIALLLTEIIVFSMLSDYFFTLKNLFSIGLNISVLGIVAIGQTLCILTSDFDLSVGGAACFTGVVIGVLFEKMGLPYGVALILALLTAACIGLINGLLITKVKINAFITTMATDFMLGGLVILVSNSQAILVSGKVFSKLGTTTFTSLKIPLPMIIALVLYAVFAWFLRNTILGRHIYCIGGNSEAAKIAGINIDAVKIITYIFSSVLAGFAGIILASRMNASQITVGATYGMESIAAAVLGGTILAGGKGKILGTLIGVLITGILSNGLTMLGVSQAWRDIATGLLLIFAIIMQNVTDKIKK
jgi:ribose/xylose/arabinose/galactoside ABC-type transport system permease subunit